MFDIINMMPYNGFSQMLRNLLKMEKSVIAAVSCWPWVYSLELDSRYSTAKSGTVTRREWGLWLYLSALASKSIDSPK